ncbi:hypothetical protein ABZ557_01595 [Streptomyces sp. NPDC019645]
MKDGPTAHDAVVRMSAFRDRSHERRSAEHNSTATILSQPGRLAPGIPL